VAHWFKHRNRSVRQCSKVFGKKQKGNKMKKIIILIATLLPIFAHAENMCVKNGSVMVVLDPQIGGTALAYNNTGKTWSTQFPYGIISGIGGCSNESPNVQGAVASDQNITPYTGGTYCYCKMLRPIESAWVFSGLSTGYTCASSCTRHGCSTSSTSSVALRAGLFGNIIE